MMRWIQLLLAALAIAAASGCATIDGYAPERTTAYTHPTESLDNVGLAWEKAAAAPGPTATMYDVEPMDEDVVATILEGFRTDVWQPYLNSRAPPQVAQFGRFSRQPFLNPPSCIPQPRPARPPFNLGPVQGSGSFCHALQISLIPQFSVGSGTATFTRASTAYQQDFEGKLNLALSGEARMQGARRVRNVLSTSSEAITAAPWISVNGGTGSAATATAGFTDPNGGSTAFRITATRGAGTAAGDYSMWHNPVTISAGDYRYSTWIKSNTASSQSVLTQYTDNLAANVVVATTTWQRFSPPVRVSPGGTEAFGWGVRATNGDANIDILVWHPQTENVTGQSNQNPSEYVSVGVLSAPYHGAGVDGVKYFSTLNGNTVASNVVTEATGAAIVTGAAGVAATAPVDAGGPFGYLSEGARTNLALQSQTLGTTWTQNNVTISADAVAAPDGTTTADKIVEAATTTTHTVLQTQVGTSGVYTMSVHLKAAERTWAYVTEGNAVSARAYFDLANGVVGQVLGTGSPSATIKALPNGWYRCTLTFTAGANANTQFGPTLADNDTPTYLGDITKGLYAWGAQLELGAFASTYIPTTTVAVTRAADVLTYPLAGNMSDTAGTIYAEAVSYTGATGAANNRIIGRNSVETPLYYNTAIKAGFYDGTNSVVSGSAAAQFDGLHKFASSWGAGGVQAVIDGGTVGTGSYDGALNQPAIGVGVGQTGVNEWYGTIRNLRIYPVALSSGNLVTLTTDAVDWLLPENWAVAANDDYFRIAANGR